MTGGPLGLVGKGNSAIEGQLMTPRAWQNSEAMIKVAIDNSRCEKMVANIKFDLKRTIVAYAMTSDHVKKEFKDEQIVMHGKFNDQVAPKEPAKISRDYAILLKKVRDTDIEANRFFMRIDFETGNPLHPTVHQMQQDVLPSVQTPNIQISYEVVTSMGHEGIFSSSQDVPSVHFPIYVTLDPQGPFDMGREY